ncbi:alpha/beta hydrolase [Phenylobacterium sp.]|uniref:alpha/beta hydrolase n=1 Tax=Phenylobacterium sp. TaxID=1871053 RepID=UPI00374D3BB7
MRRTAGLTSFVAAVAMAWGALAAPAGHPILQVGLAPGLSAPTGGRLLVFAQPIAAAQAKAKNGELPPVDLDPFDGVGSAVAATEVARVAPGEVLDIDLDGVTFPQAFSHLPPGEYAMQAVLDVNHDYNYAGRGAGDLVSPVTRMRLPLDSAAALTLSKALPARDPWTRLPGVKAGDAEGMAALRAHVAPIAFTSPALSAFWGRPIAMLGWVLTPPGYEPGAKATYPTVYVTSGFGGNFAGLLRPASTTYAAMAAHQAPPMIWVFLDHSSPVGTHEFADGVNNGPWGRALTQELIPDLERHYRMDARVSSRFVTGHSSGGWATLWLQTRYPKVFGGAWATAPDPSDFHDFTGVDIYAPHANVYRKPDGSAWPLVRDHGQVVASLEQFVRMEEALGDYGGQFRAFDWVFSPKGPDGRPLPMFNRATGDVDPAVVAYWRDHYDIAHRLAASWPALKPDLDGKIRVAVGTADTFYLDGAAHRLQGVLDGLGAKSRFQFIPDRTHLDLYKIGDDDRALLNVFAWEMYAVARPGSRPPAAGN